MFMIVFDGLMLYIAKEYVFVHGLKWKYTSYLSEE